jgi:uncharacterized integral membrane protein
MSSDPTRQGAGGAAPKRKGAGAVARRVDPKTVAALAVAALLIAFGLANRQTVEVDFLLFTTDTALVIALVVAMVLGFLLGYLTHRRVGRRRRA